MMAAKHFSKNALLLAGLTLLAAGPALAAYSVRCLGDPPLRAVTRGDSSKDYVSLAQGGITIPLQGPGELSGYVKMALKPGATRKGALRFAGVPGLPEGKSWSFSPSSKDRFPDLEGRVPSGGKKITFAIPEGRHSLKIKGDPQLMVILYYEGPEQPLPREKRGKPVKPAKKAKKKSGWDIRKSAGLGITYDDNIVHYSEDLIDEYVGGAVGAWYISESEEPELEYGKYRLRSYDDIILSPDISLEARRTFWSLGQTRFKANFSYSRYLYNPIKDVKSLKLTIRQVLPGSGQSLEFSYAFTPEKYIRELTDRPPYAAGDDPRPWVGFRFASNDWTLVYRHRLHKKLNFKLHLETGLRYYNLPFIEQDLADYEAIGTLYWDPVKSWRLTAIYGAARGWTRRTDTVEEEALTSDDNDNSYTQDRYRVDLTWKPKKFFFESINLRYQLRLMYFTSPKLLWDDPFHVGRKDIYHSYRITFGRDLTKKIGASYSVDYSQRILKSPFTGDISEGMDYDNLRFWIDLTYSW